jgi:hypothetical protein
VALVAALVMAGVEGMALLAEEGLGMAWAAILAAVIISARIAKRETSGLRFLKSHRFICAPNLSATRRRKA